MVIIQSILNKVFIRVALFSQYLKGFHVFLKKVSVFGFLCSLWVILCHSFVLYSSSAFGYISVQNYLYLRKVHYWLSVPGQQTLLLSNQAWDLVGIGSKRDMREGGDGVRGSEWERESSLLFHLSLTLQSKSPSLYPTHFYTHTSHPPIFCAPLPSLEWRVRCLYSGVSSCFPPCTADHERGYKQR